MCDLVCVCALGDGDRCVNLSNVACIEEADIRVRNVDVVQGAVPHHYSCNSVNRNATRTWANATNSGIHLIQREIEHGSVLEPLPVYDGLPSILDRLRHVGAGDAQWRSILRQPVERRPLTLVTAHG